MVIDNADLILPEIIKTLGIIETSRVHFLLCAHEVDWRKVNGYAQDWSAWEYIDVPLSGLTKKDAEDVITYWRNAGAEGIGELDGLTYTEQVDQLMKAAAELYGDPEGSFLGAMLAVRRSKGLKNRVLKLLESLKDRQISNCESTLLDAFGFIALIHNEKLDMLGTEVLAAALGCQPGDIYPKVIKPLGKEAALAISSQFIYTRHRSIAEVALEILIENFEYKREDKLLTLNKAAYNAFKNHRTFPKYQEWLYLSSEFFKRGEKTLGINIATGMHYHAPNDTHYIVQLAKLWRENSMSDKSIELLRQNVLKVAITRGYFYEWAVCEGEIDNLALNVWLAGVSLADNIEGKSPTPKQKMSFGVGIALGKLYDRYHDIIFLKACASVIKLARKINVHVYLDTNAAAEREKIIKANLKNYYPTDRQAIDDFVAGIVAAWKICEVDFPPEAVRPGDQLTFTGLPYLLRIEY